MADYGPRLCLTRLLGILAGQFSAMDFWLLSDAEG